MADDNLIPSDAMIREFVGGSTIPIPHNEWADFLVAAQRRADIRLPSA